MSSRPRLDVAALPSHGFDTRAPLWWGNLFLLVIETTMFGILIASYFYLSQNFNIWPPPHSGAPYQLNTEPGLLLPSINLLALVLSCGPMYWADQSARRGNKLSAKIALVICLLFVALIIVLRGFEFSALRFKWYSNAYGSIVWFLLGMHLLHLLTLAAETVFIMIWIFFRPFDEKHRIDITVTAVYWYWVVGIWIPLYAILYFGPRII